MLEDSVRCAQYKNIFLEHYHCIRTELTEISRHAHEEYQFGISVSKGGVYDYRGATHGVPARSLAVIHSGEPHSTRETEIKIILPNTRCFTSRSRRRVPLCPN